MIWQHPVLNTARQRQADALAALLMLAPKAIVHLVWRLRSHVLPGRRHDPAAQRISLQAEYDESGAGG
jgi:hypothetical protein